MQGYDTNQFVCMLFLWLTTIFLGTHNCSALTLLSACRLPSACFVDLSEVLDCSSLTHRVGCIAFTHSPSLHILNPSPHHAASSCKPTSCNTASRGDKLELCRLCPSPTLRIQRHPCIICINSPHSHSLLHHPTRRSLHSFVLSLIILIISFTGPTSQSWTEVGAWNQCRLDG